PTTPTLPHSLHDALPILGIIFGIFYFVLILPMRQKQKKLDELVARLKPGDKIILSAGIFGTVEGVEPDGLLVRVSDKTKIKVLRDRKSTRLNSSHVKISY